MPGFRAEESLSTGRGYDRSSEHRIQAERMLPAFIVHRVTGPITYFEFWGRQCLPAPQNTPPICFRFRSTTAPRTRIPFFGLVTRSLTTKRSSVDQRMARILPHALCPGRGDG
jgi:hypothetical protein